MNKSRWIDLLVEKGWQDGSGSQTFLRAPNYDKTRLVLMADDQGWHARICGWRALPGKSPPEAIRELLIEIVARRNAGRVLLNDLGAAQDELDALSAIAVEAPPFKKTPGL